MLTRASRRFRDMRTVVFALLPAMLLSGCANPGDAAIKPMQGEFVIALERAEDVPPGSLYLKPIPGGFLGRSAGGELFRSKPGREVLRISAPELSARVERFARLALSDADNPGELATPRNLRMARIGAFFEPLVHSTGCNNFRTGLSAAIPASAMLVYVDRPGTVRGTRYLSPWIVDYRLEFPEAGIYAVALRSQGMVVTPQVIDVARPLQATVRRAPCA